LRSPFDGNTGIWFTCSVKATIEIPDELYRQVKAKSALEGKAVREVTEELFRRYVTQEDRGEAGPERAPPPRKKAGTPPPWFGILRSYAANAAQHDMGAIRDSIARGIATERKQ
jgi:hypothetical protein